MTRTCGLNVPNVARYQLRHTPTDRHWRRSQSQTVSYPKKPRFRHLARFRAVHSQKDMILDNCKLCHIDNGMIERGEYWTLVLNENQTLLGRCYFALNRHETDPTTLTVAEQLALFDGLKRMKQALDTLFSPDHYNYVSLNNVEPHVHAHIIPRYATWREFAGKRFTDGHLGAHYDAAADQRLPELGYNDLIERIKVALPKSAPLETDPSKMQSESIKRGQHDPAS